MLRLFISLLVTLLMMPSVLAADFTLTSTSFANNQRLPKQYTCDGGNVSPQFSWQNPPTNTKSYVLLLMSPDWLPNKIYGWILYNIPLTTTSLPQGANKQMPEGIMVGLNYYYEAAYAGPCPPDNRTYHYTATIYALDTMLDLSGDAEPDDVTSAMQGHILDQAQYKGTYSH